MNAEKASAAKSSAVEGVDDLFEVSTAAVRKLQTDEIVIGLCAPAGSPVHKVAEELQRLLVQRYGYECEIIRLSRFIEEVDGSVESTSRFERIQKLIDKGNELRRRFGHSVLADLAISRIARAREKAKIASKDPRYSGRRVCYIIDSIKNSEELDILRLVYREMFYFMGPQAALRRSNEASARYWWHRFCTADAAEDAYAAWTLFLATADRRAERWMSLELAQSDGLTNIFALLKRTHVNLNWRALDKNLGGTSQRNGSSALVWEQMSGRVNGREAYSRSGTTPLRSHRVFVAPSQERDERLASTRQRLHRTNVPALADSFGLIWKQAESLSAGGSLSRVKAFR